MEVLEYMLTSALERKPMRLLYDTIYTHKNIKDWLQNILPDWDIRIPNDEYTEKTSIFVEDSNTKKMPQSIIPQEEIYSEIAVVSEWPASGFCRNAVKKWINDECRTNGLKGSFYKDNPDDLIDGACEPLASFLSQYIKKDLELNDQWLSRPDYLRLLYKDAKTKLQTSQPRISARDVFRKYIRQETPSPNFWADVNLENASFKDFLFGYDRAKTQILKESEIRYCQSVICIPLYVLCYLFDNDELNNDELKQTTEETAQYSLHAVGLVMYLDRNTLIIADPNGALRGGSNMEFVLMPLKELISEPTTTTCVSRYNRDQGNHVDCYQNMYVEKDIKNEEHDMYTIRYPGKRKRKIEKAGKN